MAKISTSLVNSMNGLSKVLKVILALPFLDIVWNIYRVARSVSKGHVLGTVLSILLIIIGIPFMWLVDIITIVVANKVVWID